MRRAVLAGVETIEHGDDGTPEVFRLMAERGVAFCPTLAAGDALREVPRMEEGRRPSARSRARRKRASVRGGARGRRRICFGGDVGVFAHGDNVRELELMVEYGMPVIDAVRAATAGNARP